MERKELKCPECGSEIIYLTPLITISKYYSRIPTPYCPTCEIMYDLTYFLREVIKSGIIQIRRLFK